MRHHTDQPARSPENPVPKPTPFKSEVEGAQWTPLCSSQLEKVQGGNAGWFYTEKDQKDLIGLLSFAVGHIVKPYGFDAVHFHWPRFLVPDHPTRSRK